VDRDLLEVTRKRSLDELPVGKEARYRSVARRVLQDEHARGDQRGTGSSLGHGGLAGRIMHAGTPWIEPSSGQPTLPPGDSTLRATPALLALPMPHQAEHHTRIGRCKDSPTGGSNDPCQCRVPCEGVLHVTSRRLKAPPFARERRCIVAAVTRLRELTLGLETIADGGERSSKATT
jgi:hypothetical protein